MVVFICSCVTVCLHVDTHMDKLHCMCVNFPVCICVCTCMLFVCEFVCVWVSWCSDVGHWYTDPQGVTGKGAATSDYPGTESLSEASNS